MSFKRLLPGLADEVTLNNITTKLSWRDFYMLSTVSRAWCDAIRSRKVYSARVEHGCTEQLVLVNSLRMMVSDGIALLSVRDNSRYELPLMPGGFPTMCHFLSLEGKVYVLGGYSSGSWLNTDMVYVLDLVGQKQWNKCASMIQQRSSFICGVMDGKIYVFGYLSDHAEVYDPKEDTWSQIMPTTISVCLSRLVSIHRELWFNRGLSRDSALRDVGHRAAQRIDL